MDTDVMAHVTSGALIVYAIEWAKGSKLVSWMTPDTKRLQRTLSALAALVSALGISVAGGAEIGWTIHIPPAAVLLAAVWEFAKQFVTQQIIYDGVVQKSGKPTA